jgi:hypothetical protein
MNIYFKETQFGHFCLIEEDLISNCINDYGGWEQHLQYFYTQFIKPDDVIIVHLPVNTTWFKLITADDTVANIVKPDSLNYKGSRWKDSLYNFYGTLTGDNHWLRLWYINFFSVMTLLNTHNKKFVWFFDCNTKLHFNFDQQIIQMPESVQSELIKMKKASFDPSPYYLGLEFADHLCWHLPDSLKECGHHDEQAHKFWAVNVLVPYIKEHLT